MIISILIVVFLFGYNLDASCQNVESPYEAFINRNLHDGDSLMNTGNYSSAIEKYAIVLNSHPEHYDARLNRAYCYMYISYFTEAKKDINYLIKHNRQDHSLTKVKGKLYFLMGDWTSAAMSYEIYVGEVPDDPEGWYLWGLMEKKGKMYKTALYHLNKANELHGGNYYEALTVMGNIYNEREDYKMAEEYYRLAIKADSTQGLPYYLLGDLSLFRHDTALALNYYDTAILVNVNDNHVVKLVNQSLIDLGYIDYAIKRYVEQVNTDPTNAVAWNNLGVSYLYAENYKEALDCFDHALVYDQDNAQYYFSKGLALIGMNNSDQGLIYISESAKMGNYYAKKYLAMPIQKRVLTGLQVWALALQIIQLSKL